ncbi:MAG: PIN domain-containing protein [Propionibacteriaceae bacterium]|jgi:PIN domain nuclease of toxin-antitoxin system|nr:PIN domain-containing protein [Propionibacteriaceae bacterium]
MSDQVTRVCCDASVIVTLIAQERGWEAIHRLVTRPDVQGVLPGPVLAEVVYVARRKGNTSSGQAIWDTLASLGLAVKPATAPDLVRAAGLIELSDAHPGPAAPATGVAPTLSLGDALALAVTERLGLPIVTRDTYWKWLVDEELLSVKVVVP